MCGSRRITGSPRTSVIGHDPTSKGIVEHLVGYSKTRSCARPRLGRRPGRRERRRRRLVRRSERRRALARSARSRPSGSLRSWRCCGRCRRCGRGSVGSSSARSIGSRPSGSLRRVTRCRHRSSARTVEAVTFDGRVRVYDIDGELVAEHAQLAPGEAAVLDEHYPTPRRAAVARAAGPHRRRARILRSREIAEAFIRARRRGRRRRCCPKEIEVIVDELLPAHGAEAVAQGVGPSGPVRPLPRRGPALDPGDRPRRCPNPSPAGDDLVVELPAADVRRSTPIASRTSHDPAPPLRRSPPISKPASAVCELGAMRRQGADVLATAKTNGGRPTNCSASSSISRSPSRDASNARNRLAAARFPVDKTLDEFASPTPAIPQKLRLPDHPRMDRPGREPLPRRTRRHRQDPHAHRARPHRRRRRPQSPLLDRRRSHRTPLPRRRRQHRRQSDRTTLPQRPAHHRRDRLRPPRSQRLPAPLPPRRRRLRTTLPRDRAHTARSNNGAGSCPTKPPPPASSTGSATTPTSSPPPATATGSPTAPPEGDT